MKYDPNEPTRILTLWQPWASAMALGLKQYETRPPLFAAKYRGWVLIHASGNRTAIKHGAPSEAIRRIYAAAGIPDVAELPTGKVLCLVRFVAAHHTAEIEPRLSFDERALGDYSAGRWALETADRLPLPHPVPFKGAQGLRHAPDWLCRAVAEQLNAAR